MGKGKHDEAQLEDQDQRGGKSDQNQMLRRRKGEEGLVKALQEKASGSRDGRISKAATTLVLEEKHDSPMKGESERKPLTRRKPLADPLKAKKRKIENEPYIKPVIIVTPERLEEQFEKPPLLWRKRVLPQPQTESKLVL